MPSSQVHNSHGLRWWWSSKNGNITQLVYNLLFVLANESWQLAVQLILPKERKKEIKSIVHCICCTLPVLTLDHRQIHNIPNKALSLRVSTSSIDRECVCTHLWTKHALGCARGGNSNHMQEIEAFGLVLREGTRLCLCPLLSARSSVQGRSASATQPQ